MNKKAFTLVEMIGVVAILSLIILIAVPNISESLKSSRNSSYQVQIKEIESASRTWSIYNSDNLPENDEEIIITLLQLKVGGFITYDFKNPKTGELFPDDLQIKITKKGLNYVYDVLEDTGSESIESIDPSGPQIVLNGSAYMYIEVNSETIIPGATYKNSNGNNVNVNNIQYKKKVDENLISVDSIDFSELGSYVVMYSATVNGRTNSIERYVEIVDTTAPEIVIDGYTDGICVDTEISQIFYLPTPTVTDNYSVLVEAETIGNVSNIPGKKEIIYKAVDDNNNESQFILCLNMKDTIKPTINNVEIVESNELNSNIVIVSASDSGVGLHNMAYSFDGGTTWQKDNYFVINGNSYMFEVIVRDKIGLQSEIETLGSIPPTEFTYTGEEQIFTVPKTGYYKLESWGAQGGSYSTSCIGGYGGYSTGIAYFEKGEPLYINVGGEGLGDGTHTTRAGGYNGGGTATVDSDSHTRQSSGGGATHIAKISGLLSALENEKENILIVAGGGGGGAGNSVVMCTSGGSGGGITGVQGQKYDESTSVNGIGFGGSQDVGGQTEGSKTGTNGSFGHGANDTYAGGGGGLYGGGVLYASAGGGSGYIGNSLLTDKYMYCYECETSDDISTKTYTTTNVSSEAISNYVKSGDGYARITFLGSIPPTEFTYTGEEQIFTVPKTGYYKLESWGAQGGSSGGYGSYASGQIILNTGEELFINVGGTTTNGTGGYNGGGSVTGNVYGGGGATHIATTSGLLSELSPYATDCNNLLTTCPILIVSGGGGGLGNGSAGGAGGGIQGVSGSGDDYGLGGTQTAGGTVTSSNLGAGAGSFGLGGSGSWSNEALGGGGGGFYGGASGGGTNNNGGGGGGSGYIGNPLLTEKYMYCYECETSDDISTKTYTTTNVSSEAISNYVKSGDGYARITFLGIE